MSLTYITLEILNDFIQVKCPLILNPFGDEPRVSWLRKHGLKLLQAKASQHLRPPIPRLAVVNRKLLKIDLSNSIAFQANCTSLIFLETMTKIPCFRCLVFFLKSGGCTVGASHLSIKPVKFDACFGTAPDIRLYLVV